MSPALLLAWASLAPAHAVELSLEWQDTLRDGLVLEHYRASSPATDVWVARVDLCEDHVRVDATAPPSSYQSTGSWGEDRGVQLATNGDFYTSGPQVYGDAVGWGAAWPVDQTGKDSSGSWYYQDYGWVAFLHDEVTFTHSGWVKTNLAPSTGWAPTELAPEPPPGTLALVSGFPELVIDGEVVSCSSPTADSCFPDRSDMRDRHPRTAMGLTEDHATFLLVTVDGRTSSNSGMYGAELAEVMGKLGAHVAFNLDGGGSAQMWTEDDGYVNDVSGNNSGSSARTVANHWGVLAGSGSGTRVRPAHCEVAEPCEAIGPGGATLDDQGECLFLHGDPTWWREEAAGTDGHLYWTNAWANEVPENWAWWRMDLEEAGDYELSVYLDPDFSVYGSTRYEVRASGTSHELIVDQGAGDGWHSLGTYALDAGGEQWVAVFDNYEGSVSSSQHISVDALRVERVGDWCGDDTCGPDEGCDCPEDCALDEELPDNGVDDDCDGEVDEGSGGGSDEGGASDDGGSSDEGSGGDTATDESEEGKGTRIPGEESRGCAAAPVPALSLFWLLGLLGAAGRRPQAKRTA